MMVGWWAGWSVGGPVGRRLRNAVGAHRRHVAASRVGHLDRFLIGTELKMPSCGAHVGFFTPLHPLLYSARGPSMLVQTHKARNFFGLLRGRHKLDIKNTQEICVRIPQDIHT